MSGGVCIYVLTSVYSTAVALRMPLETVAVRVMAAVDITICNVCLLPDGEVPQHVLAALIAKLPPPYMVFGDFNDHNPLWGGTMITGRGRDDESSLSQLDLCLLNNGAPHPF